MSLPHSLRRLVLPLAASVLLLCTSCFELELHGVVTPLSKNRTYTLSDSALIYKFYDDKVDAVIHYTISNDTIRNAHVQLNFYNQDDAEDFFHSFATITDVRGLSTEGTRIVFTTVSYNDLSVNELVQVLNGFYTFSEPDTDVMLPESRELLPSSSPLRDGTKLALLHTNSNGVTYFHALNTFIGRQNKRTNSYIATREPWRIRLANDGRHCYLQMGNGRYLRCSGFAMLPTALTTCTDISEATPWLANEVIPGKDIWAFSALTSNSTDYYGLACDAEEKLSIGANKIETFTLLTQDVAVKLACRTHTLTEHVPWGSTYTLPQLNEPSDSDMFIGWNTVENSIEGFLPPGTSIEADNVTYHAVYVKTGR